MLTLPALESVPPRTWQGQLSDSIMALSSSTSFSRTWIWANSTEDAMSPRMSASLIEGRNNLLKISMLSLRM